VSATNGDKPIIELLREKAPVMGIVGEELYDRTEPAQFAEAENDYPWAKYLASLGEVLEPIAVVTRPESGEEQWIVLASPKRCPDAWLPVLAQWAGVRRPDTMSKDDLRALIGPRAPGMWRGTRAAMIAAVTRFMPPGTPPEQMLYFEERADGDAYKLRVFTYSFIEHDPVAVQDALLHEKPAGLTLLYEVRVGQTWAMLNYRKQTWAQVMAEYADWYEVMHDMPIEIVPAPELTSVTPVLADTTTAAFTALTLTGYFPDDPALWWVEFVDTQGASYSGEAVKVSETQVTADMWLENAAAGVGQLRIVDDTLPYTNDVAFEMTGTPAAPGPSLDVVTPDSAVRLAPVLVTFTGYFPDDMTGFTATIDAPGELVAAVPGPVTKVSDTECNATITTPHVGAEGVGVVRIVDAGGADYANSLPFTVTLA
jgi:hypothetical protein